MNQLNNTGEASASPNFVIRDLKSGDLWQMTRVLSKIGIRDFAQGIDPSVIKASQFKAPQTMDKDGNLHPLPRDRWTEAQIDAEMRAEMANNEMLWSILGMLMDHIGDCEGEVNKLLANGAGLTVAEIEAMPVDDYMQLIDAYISRDGFRDFFMQALRLLDKVRPRSKSDFGGAMATLTH